MLTDGRDRGFTHVKWAGMIGVSFRGVNYGITYRVIMISLMVYKVSLRVYKVSLRVYKVSLRVCKVSLRVCKVSLSVFARHHTVLVVSLK